jgi:hypothetical protein
MPTQLKLSDILNILSIGIIFQLILLFFLYTFDPNNIIIKKTAKLDATLLTGLAVIFSFPSWRIVSNFVEFVMYPIKINSLPVIEAKTKGLKKFLLKILFLYRKIIRWLKMTYRLLFFGLSFSGGVDRDNLARSIKSAPLDACNSLMISNFKSFFSIDIKTMDDKELFKIYYLCKSYLSMNKDVYDNLYSVRYNTVLNYHTRLATLSNIFTIGCLVVLAKSFSLSSGFGSIIPFLKTNLIFYLCVFSIVCSRFFGSYCSQYSKRESDLLVYDFNTMFLSKKVEPQSATEEKK